MSSKKLPALFVGHGSPMNAIMQNDYTTKIAEYPRSIDVPDAIVVISAHWLTRSTFITAAAHPEQIYDFYGFPGELYNLKYTPPGSPGTAEMITGECSFIRADPVRGIDHAAWAVAKHMYPGCDVPLLEISLDMRLSPREHFLAGRELGKLRHNKILFIGSGNIVHNLSIMDYDTDAAPFDWAVAFDDWMKKKIAASDTENLINYRTTLENYKLAFPTDEHYLPMLYILGMADAGEKPFFIHESIQNGSVSMRTFEIK